MLRMTSRQIFAGASSLIVFLAVSTAWAQPGGGRGGPGGFGGFGFGGFGGGSVLFTVLSEQVQKELEISDEQKASLQKLAEEIRGQRPDFQALRDLSPEEREKKMKEMEEQRQARSAETNKKVSEILLPSQQERLREIIIQTRGVQAAANNDDLAKALGLTDEQKQKIKDIAGQDLQKMIEEKVLSVLTSDQKAKLEKMKAKKFEFDPAAGGFGGRRNRGGRGGENPPATEKKEL